MPPSVAGERGNLPDPVVPPDVYDEQYYETCCGGFEEWHASQGAQAAGIYHYALERAGFKPGEVLVDVGSGRGELLALAVKKGASRAVGIEYAEAAVRLAQKTLAAQGAEAAEAIAGDARDLPVEDEMADLVTMLDVVEHLAPPELDAALREALRVLKPGGRLLVHTFPSRTLYDVTYRFQRNVKPWRRRTWPADPRLDVERLMHVNEQTVPGLGAALKAAGFVEVKSEPGTWVYDDFVPTERAKRLYHVLARMGSLSRFGVANMWAEGRKP
jgi:cyclopropane fatty-acyl-phospholipid synthase-like methyltransferase